MNIDGVRNPSSFSHVGWLGGVRPANRRVWNHLLAGLLVAAGYYLGTLVGFDLTPPDSAISFFWPPNAILTAALLMTPVSAWWVILGFVLPTHLAIQLREGVAIWTCLGWYIGNCGEAVLAAACVRRFVRTDSLFENTRGVLTFIAGAVIFAPGLTSFLDAGSVVLTGGGETFWRLFTARLLSNTVAQLIFVPLIVLTVLRLREWIKNARPRNYGEAGALVAGILLLAVFELIVQNAPYYVAPALMYVSLILLLWAALRFGAAAVSATMLSIVLIYIEAISHGHRVFGSSNAASIIWLQVLVCVVGTTLLLLTTVLSERARAEAALGEVSLKVIDAQEKERERISRELHDDIGQQLVMIESGLSLIENESDAAVKEQLHELQQDVAEISRAARQLSHGLHPAHLDHLGLKAAICRLCNDVSQRNRVTVLCDTNELQTLPSANISLCLYRVAQEALKNAIQHGSANEVVVQLSGTQQEVSLRIADNGKGFDPKQADDGLGLLSMRERIRAAGGTISVATTLGRGTQIHAIVPCAPTQ